MDADRMAVPFRPPLYAPWVEEVLGGPVPEERHATCSACAMCQPTAPNAATASSIAFDPAAKCCTYLPTLPNFLVGLILDDEDAAAIARQASVEGRKQFGDALLKLLTMVERHVGLWAATELGEPLVGLGPALLPYYATELTSPAHTWSPRWLGRPQDFYRESARLAQPLSWTQVLEIGGPELALLVGQVRATYGAMQSEEVPRYLQLGAVGSIARDENTVALTGHNTNDMPLLPKPLAEALRGFDGRRPTVTVHAEIARHVGILLDQSSLRRLVDFGLLVARPDQERNAHER